MNSKIFWQLNEAYQLGVCAQEVAEEIHSSEELEGIKEWVEALIEEGYDLDQYTDEELCEAYLEEAGRLHSSSDQQASWYEKKYGNKSSKSDKEISKEPGGKDFLERIKKTKANPKYTAEDVDLYDVVSEYLVSEGFCDSYEDADVIMVNMSEEWRESIVNSLTESGFISPYKAPPAHGRSIQGDPEKGETLGNPARLSPSLRALQKSDQLQAREPGSQRQINQTRRSDQLNRMFSSARNV